jgi:hypothetical protein
MKDLVTFAQEQRKPGQRCRTCFMVPAELREQIALARTHHTPPSWETISKWLKTQHKIRVSSASLRGHYARCTGEEE